MRQSCLPLPLLLASSLLFQAAWAQRAAVAPLAPVQAVAEPVDAAKSLWQPVSAKAPSVAGQPALAAVPAPSQVRPVIPQPLYLINSRIIVGRSLGRIQPAEIATMVVHKSEDMPPRWRTATAGSVIDLTLKPGVRLRSVSLARLKRRQHLAGPVRFELDGRPLADTSLRIAPRDIETLVVTIPANKLAYKVLNIILIMPDDRPAAYPPGTILIRGVAGR